jgi:thiamine biosynthesis lipoprotein
MSAAELSACRRARLLALATIGAVCAACGGATAAPPHLISRSHPTMGAEVRITVWTADEPAAVAAMTAVFAEFDRLDALLSVWKPESDVLRINAGAGGAPVPVSAETIEAIRAAQEISELTAGKFDITFGALAGIWKFDHDQDNHVPAAAEIAARLPLIDYHAVRVDAAAHTVAIARPGVRVHLGGIGKGYALDRGISILRGRGFHDFLIQSGGDLFAAGQPGERPWKLGINDPRGEAGDSFATVELRDRTFSTSGDYERAFVKDGVRYHHLLDPDTGQPARGCRSVTVVAPTATRADGLSTGVFILGPEAGLALVERLPDVDAVIVTADNRVLISSGLQGKVHLLHPPAEAP